MQRIVQLSSAVILVLVSVLAILQVLYSETSLPLQTNTSMTIDSSQSTLSDAEILAALETIGARTGTPIYKLVPDVDDTALGTDLIAVGADQPEERLVLTYLDPSRHGFVYPASQRGAASLQGQYALVPAGDVLADLQQWARTNDVTLITHRTSAPELILGMLTATGGWIAALAAGVFAAACAMAWFASKASSRTYRLLAGHRPARIHLEDCLGLAIVAVPPVLLGAAALVAVIGVVRDQAQALRVASALVPYGAGLALFIGLLAVGLSLATAPSTASVARRARPIQRFEMASALVKVLVLAIAAACFPALLVSAGDSYTRSQEVTRWKPLASFVGLRVTGASDRAYFARQADVGALVARARLAEPVTLSLALRGSQINAGSLGGFDAIVVTDQQFCDIMLTSAERGALRAVDLDSLPASVRAYVNAQFPIWAKGDSSTRWRFFTFGGDAGFPALGGAQDRYLSTRNPLIALIDSPASLSDDFLAATASSQNLIFGDAERTRHEIKVAKLGDFITSVERIGDQAVLASQFAYQMTLIRILAMLIVAMAMILTVSVSARVYAFTYADRHFTLRSNGWAWPEILARRFVTEAVLVTLMSLAGVAAGGMLGVTGATWALLLPPVYMSLSCIIHASWANRCFGLVAQRQLTD